VGHKASRANRRVRPANSPRSEHRCSPRAFERDGEHRNGAKGSPSYRHHVGSLSYDRDWHLSQMGSSFCGNVSSISRSAQRSASGHLPQMMQLSDMVALYPFVYGDAAGNR
jgi:hypothetical protein